jgi:hypothetical protein
VVDRDLGDLVRRRLFELGLNAQDLARRSRGELSGETVRGLVRGLAPVRVSDRLAGSLARALDVTEYRVRKAAGLSVREPFVPRTRPHLRVVRREEPRG